MATTGSTRSMAPPGTSRSWTTSSTGSRSPARLYLRMPDCLVEARAGGAGDEPAFAARNCLLRRPFRQQRIPPPGEPQCFGHVAGEESGDIAPPRLGLHVPERI